MAHVDFATSTVNTAPSPATTGTSLVVATGHGARFPATPFYAVVHPDGTLPTLDTAEKVQVTGISTDTFTIVRHQGSTSAQSIAIGWRISAAIFANDIDSKQDSDQDLTDIAALSPTNDDLLQRKSGAWTNRTPAQVKVDLALVKADVGLGSVTNDAQLKIASNLSDVNSATTSRTNLGVGTGDSPQFAEVNLGNASDTTVGRTSAGVINVEGVDVTLQGATTQTHKANTIELGHASDTTLSRSASGKLAVEGTDVLLSGGALGTPSSGTLTNATGLPVSGITASTSTALGVGSIELGHASDTTISRTGAGAIAVEGTAVLLSGGALGTPSSGTLTNATGLPVSGITASTSTALGVGSVELGHASDTTISRTRAGVAAVEGKDILTTDNTSGIIFDHVESGCVWSGDSYGSTKAASMTSGVVWIGGKRLTVAAVTARTFTASKDVYVGLNDNGDGTAAIVYYDNTTNAASPSLVTGGYTLLIAIIVVGASNIANAGSVNQGQEDKVLPIASSIAYTTTDSLGNLICPRDPQRRILGYRQVTAAQNFTTAVDATGLSVPFIAPANRKVRITFFSRTFIVSQSDNNVSVAIQESSTVLTQTEFTSGNPAGNANVTGWVAGMLTPSSGLHTYKVVLTRTAGAGTGTMAAASTNPAYLMVELI